MARFGMYDLFEMAEEIDSDGELWVYFSDHINEFFSKDDAIKIIAHLQKVFDLGDGE